MKRSRYKIPDWLKNEWPQVASPPSADTHIQKIMHSMPLPVFLLASFVWFCVSIALTVVSFFIDGPIRSSWTLLTALTHSILQTAMLQYLPQGRHSMFLVRLATSVRIPLFLFSNFSVSNVQIPVQSPGKVSKVVADIVGVCSPSEATGTTRIIEGEWIKFNECVQQNTVILYLHGGGHVFLSSKSHRILTMKLAEASGCEVFAIDYRLAPEYRFPAAIEDALVAFCYLTNQALDGILIPKSQGYRVILAGDSSGACLCLQLAYLLKRLQLTMPEGLVLISPFVDQSIFYFLNYSDNFSQLAF
jgi:hypothetical protein